MRVIRYLSPTEIKETWPETQVPIIAAVTFEPMPIDLALEDCSFLIYNNGAISTPHNGMDCSVEELSTAIEWLKIHYKIPSMTDMQILAAAEVILRKAGVDNIHLYYYDRGASETITIDRSGMGNTLPASARRMGRGNLAEAFAEMTRGDVR